MKPVHIVLCWRALWAGPSLMKVFERPNRPRPSRSRRRRRRRRRHSRRWCKRRLPRTHPGRSGRSCQAIAVAAGQTRRSEKRHGQSQSAAPSQLGGLHSLRSSGGDRAQRATTRAGASGHAGGSGPGTGAFADHSTRANRAGVRDFGAASTPRGNPTRPR